VRGRRRRRSASRRSLSQSSSDDASDAFTPPPVDAAQWTWLEATLLSSTADWLIVVGHHPVWSIGTYGPTWPLVERLIPLLNAAGVALYFSAHEYSMAHFRSEPHLTGVDYVIAGNGAYAAGANGSSSGASDAHVDDVVVGSLQFAYVAGTGFSVMRLVAGDASTLSQLSVTLYDAAGAQLYDFYKDNPRTQPGHTAGNLGAPPAPPPGGAAARGAARGAASSGSSRAEHAVAVGAAAALAAALGAMAVARSFAEERRASERAAAARPGGGGGGGANARARAAAAPAAAAPSERTPLVDVQMMPQKVPARAGTSRVQKFAAPPV
jgi:hypothetical protein